jgi:hypothetical protein
MIRPLLTRASGPIFVISRAFACTRPASPLSDPWKFLALFAAAGIAGAAVLIAAFSQTPDTRRPNSREALTAYKNFVDKSVSAESAAAYLRHFTAEPHPASSPRNDALARDVLAAKGLEPRPSGHLLRTEVEGGRPVDVM